MSPGPPSRIGPYEVLEPIGAGGMGEVYRARDTKLGRDVAIKVLPAAFTQDSERVARIRREAHVLASLNHPGIAAIYGLEESDGVVALALELVEGEDLATRLSHGAVPVDDAVSIAKQIAEGLEYAHEHGVVHRDLKPANVKLTQDGRAKILDFGLAKAYSNDQVTSSGGVEVSHSPTLSRQMSEAGFILGTAAYMSPEQARGRPIDKRADIWSFGVVLFEMLTGRRLFTGETITDVLAAVVRQDIDWGLLPPSAPSFLRPLVRRCLDRDPTKRLRDIGEARVAIESAISHPEAGTQLRPSLTRRALPWAVAAFAMALALVLVLSAPWRPTPEPARPVRLSVEVGADVSLDTAPGTAAILSPDGTLLVFVARKAGQQRQLYLRRLEQLEASPLSATEGARNPFFSPDGQWIGFFAGGKLKKVSLTGGASVTLCNAPDDRGGTWSEDGTILLAPRLEGLSRVSSAGGTPEVLTTPDPAARENTHRWPQALPGGNAVLYTAGMSGNLDDASIVVQSLPNGPKKVVQRGGYHGRYLRSGHLVYMHEGTLFAAPFNLGRLETSGPRAPVLEGVTANAGYGGAQFALSDSGTLAFLPGPNVQAGVSIQSMDKDGKTQPLRATAGIYNNIRLSPDGKRLAVDLRERSERDVWIYEWERDTMSRLTVDPGEDARPVWTPDGRRIVFSSTRADRTTANLFWQRADGTGEAERLTESKNQQYPASWHPSGKFLAFHEGAGPSRTDLWILPLEGDVATGWKPGKPNVFLNSPFDEGVAAFSPDGRWLAYMSDESGTYEVYVRPFPGPGSKWQVSAGGGSYPVWCRPRRELFYRTPDFTLAVAAYAVEGDAFRAEKPRQWSPGLVSSRGIASRAFDLHPDGQRMAVLKAAEQESEEKRDKVVLIQNFFDELRRVSPPAKP